MLSLRSVLSREGVELADVACRHEAGRGRPDEQTAGHALVFVRRGCFARSVDGARTLLDPTVAYCMNPGEEQRYDHPHQDGDDCTALFMAPKLVASLWGGELELPHEPLRVSPAIDLEHRLLLASGRRGQDGHELFERAVALAAQALEQVDVRRVTAGRPGTGRMHAELADGVREALAADPDHSLSALAGKLCVSPHHLSRIFRSVTGETISRHRTRLRARSAMERLSDGVLDLAAVAADAGFADQSHLCRVIRRETGRTPSALRHALALARATPAGSRSTAG